MSADQSQIDRAVHRVRETFESRRLPFPSDRFWSQLRLEIGAAIDRIDSSEDSVRTRIGRWIQHKALGDTDFSIESSIEVTVDVAVEIGLMLHQELRDFADETVPYTDQTASGPLEDLWETPIDTRFKRASYQWPRRGSGSKVPCDRCNQTGLETCPTCDGEGTVVEACPRCHGRGEIERRDKVLLAEGGRSGSSAGGGVVLRKEQCLECNGSGKISVKCKKCRGKGKITCSRCQGSGDLWIYQVVQVRSIPEEYKLQVQPDSKIRSGWISHEVSFGEPIEDAYDEESNRGRDLAGALAEGRLLYERVSLGVVGILTAGFEFGGKDRRVYEVGGQLHAQHLAPLLNRRRLVAASGIGAAALVIAGWFVLHTGSTGNNEAASPAPQTQAASDTAAWVLVTARQATLRSRPSAASSPLGTADHGVLLQVTGPDSVGWLPVRLGQEHGYVDTADVRLRRR